MICNVVSVCRSFLVLVVMAGCLTGTDSASASASTGFDDIKVVTARTPLPATADATATIVLNRIVSGVPSGDEVVESTSGPFCSDAKRLTWSKTSAAVNAKLFAVTKRELLAAEYHVPAVSENIFDTASSTQKPDFQLGVRIRDFRMTSCSHSSGLKGAVYLDTHWEVFSPRLQKVVASMDAEGSYRSEQTEDIKLADVVERAVVATVRNLLADPAFLQAVSTPASATTAGVAPERTTRIAKLVPHSGGVTQNATQLRAAVVTLEVDGRSGSGFYISQDGYLLTDQHVVGRSGFVKVRTATGRELPGEVVGIDASHDVALVKTEAPPFEPLAVQRQDPALGADVYAIGSPLGDRFNGTMTKGVMSGFRTIDGRRFLQSDVSILPGNSGGPLLDASGAVIGLTAVKIESGHGSLQLFIPIADALEQLRIGIDR